MIRICHVCCVLLVFIFASCSEEPKIQEVPASKSQSESLKGASPEEERPASLRTVWPFFKEGADVQEVAGDLLAKNYVLVFDGSGSMASHECGAGQTKMDVAKDAVVQWIETVPKDAHLGFVAFHRGGWTVWPPVAGRREELVAVVRGLQAGGNTPLTEALTYAYRDLTLQGQRQLGYGEYHVVVVTDGIANSPRNLSQLVDQVLSRSPLQISTIGFCIGENHSLNQPGRTFYRPSDNPEALRQGLSHILAESESFGGVQDSSFE